MSVRVKILERADLEILAEEMRPDDRFEFDTVMGDRPYLETLEELWGKSRIARAVYYDGQLLAAYGVLAPLLSMEGNPWLAATNLVDENAGARRVFVAGGKGELAEIERGFTRLWNIVAERNRLAVRWLKWMGFEFSGDRTLIDGYPFLHFERRII